MNTYSSTDSCLELRRSLLYRGQLLVAGYLIVSSLIASSQVHAKDLVELSQDYRLVAGMESGCAQLEKLEDLDQELNQFISTNSATEVAAQLVSGQTVTGLNQSELKASILELSGELSRTAREIHHGLEERLADINKAIEGSDASDVLSELTREYERLTGIYHCVQLDLSELGNSLTLVKLNTFIQKEKDGALAFNQWVATSLRPALRLQSSCDKAGNLDKSIGEFRNLAANFGETDVFQAYKRGDGDETESLKTLLDRAQKTKRTCTDTIAAKDGQAFEVIVEIAEMRDELDRTQETSQRVTLLQAILKKIDNLVSEFPDTPVGQSFIADDCYGPRICRDQFVYESRQLINQLASLEEEGSVELERLRNDAECGRNLDKSIEERLSCFQSALKRARVIEEMYPETEAELCLSESAVCKSLRNESLNDSIASLALECGRIGSELVARVASTEDRLSKEDLTLADEKNLLVELKANYSELERHRACSPEAQEAIKAFGANRAEALEAKILDITSSLSRIVKQFESIQKTCAQALSRPVSRNDLPQIGECLAELNEFVGTAAGSEIVVSIERGDPVVPDVIWARSTVSENESGELAAEGWIDDVAVTFVFKEEEFWTRVPQRLFNQMNLPRTIRVSGDINDRLLDRFLVELKEVRFGDLAISQIVAVIDPELSGDEVVIGLAGIEEIDRETVEGDLELRIGSVVVGSEEKVGINLRQISQEYEDLLSAAIDGIDSELDTLTRSLEDALGNRYPDDYSKVINLISDLIDKASVFDEYPALVLNLRTNEISRAKALLVAALNKETKSREDSARRLCDDLSVRIQSLETHDRLKDLEQALVDSTGLTERLNEFYQATEAFELSKNSEACPADPDWIETEKGLLADLVRAHEILGQALESQNSETRLRRYGEILDLLHRVSDSGDDSMIAKRIDDGDVISGVGFEPVEELVLIEEEAQEALTKAGGLLEEAETEDRLPRQYSLMERAASMYRDLLETEAALDRPAITAKVQKIESGLEELASRLPVEPQTVSVEPGCFWMGAREDDEDAADDEQAISVCVEAFSIGVYEVTFHEFDRFVNAKGREAPNDRGWGRDYRPVINVSYFDIASYIDWLSYQTGNSYRLPTEAEWEYAARADESFIYSWGNNRGSNRANCLNCKTDWSGQRTAPVGSFEPNSWGLYDVSGNVAEKTCSLHKDSLKNTGGSCAPLEASGSRVVRGGSWKSHSRNIRLSYRDSVDQLDHRSRFHGFRLVKSD